MDLAALIKKRKREGAGSLRDMAARAVDQGHQISHVTIGDYALGKNVTYPAESTRLALAAALGVSIEEVSAAAMAQAAPELADGPPMQLQHARAFLRKTAGRSDVEITQVLGVVDAALDAMDAVRSLPDGNGPDTPGE